MHYVCLNTWQKWICVRGRKSDMQSWNDNVLSRSLLLIIKKEQLKRN